ncbi:MAG: hypothetical protein ABSG59_05515 [Verrucomicrobiota bacterium]|jgi:hypothetical protein
MPKNPQKPQQLLLFATVCHRLPPIANSPCPANLSRKSLGGGASLPGAQPPPLFRPFRPFSSLPQLLALRPSRLEKANRQQDRPLASFPWPLPAYAPVHQALVLFAKAQPTAIAVRTTFKGFALFPVFSTLFSKIHGRSIDTQLIAPEPHAPKTRPVPLANLINFETLFFIFSRFYERQASSFSPAIT